MGATRTAGTAVLQAGCSTVLRLEPEKDVEGRVREDERSAGGWGGKRRWAVWVGVLVVIAGFGGGCAFRDPTDAERMSSLAVVAGREVEGLSLEEYLAERTWVVLSGKGVKLEPGRTVEIMGETGLGSAAMVTEDGYLLTAAHCVSERPVVVVKLGNGKVFAMEPRVVWTGKRGTAYQDVALLKVDAGEARFAYFEWAEAREIRKGMTVALAGSAWEKKKLLTTYAAGHLDETEFAESTNRAVPIRYMSFDAPGRHGDSGGPLVTGEGKLLGVVVGLAHPLLGLGTDIPLAARPQLGWLEGLIRADRSAAEARGVNLHAGRDSSTVRDSRLAAGKSRGVRSGT